MESLIGLMVLVVLAVPVPLIVALASINDLKQRIRLLEDDVAALRVLRRESPIASGPPRCRWQWRRSLRRCLIAMSNDQVRYSIARPQSQSMLLS